MNDIERRSIRALMDTGISREVARELFYVSIDCYRKGRPLDFATKKAIQPLLDGRWLRY